MIYINDIYNEIDKLAPFNTALSYDNCGIIIGSGDKKVSSCILALDVTNAVIDLALSKNAELIITHHPVIFGGINSISDTDVVYRAIQNNIGVICAHTNLDASDYGVNVALAEALELSDVKVCPNTDLMGRLGILKSQMPAKEFAQKVKSAIDAPYISYSNGDNIVKTVAVLGGSGGEYINSTMEAGADVFVSGEFKHHEKIYAINKGYSIIEAGHHYTEIPAMTKLKLELEKAFSNIEFILCNSFEFDAL